MRITGSRRALLLTATWLAIGGNILASAPNIEMTDSAELRVSPSTSASGSIQPVPLVLWSSGEAPRSKSTGDSAWESELGPAGLMATIEQEEPGAHGQQRFRIEVENRSEVPIQGHLLPGLTNWTRSEETIQHADSHHLLLSPPEAVIGTMGRLQGWFPGELVRDVFVTVPLENTDHQVCLSLLLKGQPLPSPVLTLAPQATATYELHLDTVQGDRNDVLHEIYRVRGGYRVDPDQYDFSQYRDPHFEWVTRLVAGWLNWSWDKDVLNPRTGEYHLADSLREAERLFGGYDAYMFWPFWPRAGFDARFQPDHYRNMPGGLTKLGEEIEAARDLGVRIILGHCIWSETDRDKSEAAQRASYRQLVDLACKLDADGVLMDIMATTPDEIREMAREQCHDLVPYQEWDPNWTQSQTNLVGRIHNGLPMPSFNLKRYMLPHHPQLRVCEPGHAGKVLQRDLVLSFLSGHGVEINTMFPQKQPETEHEWRTLARMLDILRINRACFASTQWRPMVRSKNSAAWINEWRSEHKTVYTICCTDPVGHEGPLLPVASSDLRYVDLWRYRPVEVVVNDDGDGDDAVAYRLDPYVPGRFNGFGDYTAGCIAAFQPRLKLSHEFETLIIDVDQPQAGEVLEIWEDKVQPDGKPITRPAASRVDVDLYQALGHHTNKAIVVRLMDSNRQLQDVVVEPETNLRFFRIDRPEPTSPVDSTSPPKDMIRIPGGTFDYIVHHGAPTWHACYHTRYSYQPGPASRPKSVTLPAFWMDQYPVTNMQYAQFVEQTGYEPADDTNFLKHFVDGAPPENKENHPVVYVSYDDATAYAEWAGKRLPTEEEWQFAAGGTQGHPWPWGNEDPSAKRCNLEVDDTTPVNAHPAGSSPFGVEDLVGNVWQWTHSLTDNGRHWVVYLRGGSWYQPPRPTGGWWVKGGPRKINDHHPIPLFGPAMNRLATVGFRCVKDEAN